MITGHSASVLQVYDFPQPFLQHIPHPASLLCLFSVGQVSLLFCFPFHITGNFCSPALKNFHAGVTGCYTTSAVLSSIFWE